MRVTISLVLITAASLFAAPLKASKKKSGIPAAIADTSAKIKSSSESDTLFSMVKVGRDQSASWLAFRHLGAWSPDIASQVKSDNPTIKNLNRLEIGEILRLRRSLDQRGQTPFQQIAKATRKAVVTYVRGSARIVRQGNAEAVGLNDYLVPGDKIITDANSSLELIIDNQSVMRLRENTTLQLVSIQDSTASQKVGTSVSLEYGRLWSKVRKWAGPLVGFSVRMPNAIAGVHGTTFECFVNTDSSGIVTVSEGVVGVMGRSQTLETFVPSGKTVAIHKDGQVTPSEGPSGKSTDWKRFNEQRDQSLEDMSSAIQDANLTSLNNAAITTSTGSSEIRPPPERK
ncbi:MAG: hypothetical protein RL173_2211 [Fibrobacterota bacterium]|jgi:ferric-dicitrate binding protein FerR (iron transport regulator)